MHLKMPFSDWSSDHFEYIIEEDEALSDFDDEPDFAEYLWMENEEEFDKTEMQRLEEEDLMKECVEAMLEDELEDELAKQIADLQKAKAEDLNSALSSLAVGERNVENSLLNPFADEFVPKSSTIDVEKL